MSPEGAASPGLHATAVVVGEAGALILGPSASGKSVLALALLARARVSGCYGALIGDDRIWVENQNGRLIARGESTLAGRIERRGVGLLTVRAEPAAVIRLAIILSGAHRPPRLPEGPNIWEAAGIAVPRLMLDSARSAGDNALVVEEALAAM